MVSSTSTLTPRITTHGIAAGFAGMLVFSSAPIIVSALLLLAYERWLAGAADVNVLGLVAFLVVLRQVNVFVVSAHMHRGAAHKHFEWHPLFEKVARVWCYSWSGSTRVWSIMHRLHHADSDTDDDVHSPNKRGGSLWNILWQTTSSYFAVARNIEQHAKYDVGLPDDAFERFAVWASRKGPLGIVLTRVPFVFAALALVFNVPIAVCLMPGAMLSMWAGTILLANGFAHRFGYRSLPTRDRSTNVFPVDVLGYGELLHHNHHALPGRANFAVLPFELDLGYWTLVLLEKLGVVRHLKREARST